MQLQESVYQRMKGHLYYQEFNRVSMIRCAKYGFISTHVMRTRKNVRKKREKNATNSCVKLALTGANPLLRVDSNREGVVGWCEGAG